MVYLAGMSEERLLDEQGLPRAYRMVEILEKVEEWEVDRELFEELDAVDGYGVNYRAAVDSIKLELAVFLGKEKSERLQGFLMDRDFDAAYELLDEEWSSSVQELWGSGEIEDWDPDTPK